MDQPKSLGSVKVMRGVSHEGEESVFLLLGQDSMFLDGDVPRPGVALVPSVARLVAYTLLAFAAQIECGVPRDSPGPEDATRE